MDDFKESLSCYESTVFPHNLLKFAPVLAGIESDCHP